MSELGTFVRDARLRLRMANGRPMSQEVLAERTGVSGATISHIESGKMRRPERDTLEALAAALGVTYNDLAIAAGYADPPSERDIEAEMRRLDALGSIEEKLEAVKRISPEIYDLVDAWAHDLVRQAGQQRRAGNIPAPASSTLDRQGKPNNGRLGC